MNRRRPRVTDFSIPLGIVGIVLIGVLWGWQVALVAATAAAILSAAALVLLRPRAERLRGTTMDVGDRPLLIHLYSPY